MARTGEPLLQQRRTRGKNKERQTDGHNEQAEQPRNGVGVARGYPTAGYTDRKHQKRQKQQEGMQENLPTDAEPTGAGVGISISSQEHGLKEGHASIPNGRRPAQ